MLGPWPLPPRTAPLTTYGVPDEHRPSNANPTPTDPFPGLSRRSSRATSSHKEPGSQDTAGVAAPPGPTDAELADALIAHLNGTSPEASDRK